MTSPEKSKSEGALGMLETLISEGSKVAFLMIQMALSPVVTCLAVSPLTAAGHQVSWPLLLYHPLPPSPDLFHCSVLLALHDQSCSSPRSQAHGVALSFVPILPHAGSSHEWIQVKNPTQNYLLPLQAHFFAKQFESAQDNRHVLGPWGGGGDCSL